MGQPDYPLLPDHLTERRRELGLGKAEAARRAGVTRATWWAWENGTRQPYDSNFAGIEFAMQWEPGSVEAIAHGGKPTGHRGGLEPRDEVEETILRNRNLTFQSKMNLIRTYRSALSAGFEPDQPQPRRRAR